MDPYFHRTLSEGFLQTYDDDQLTEPACKSDTPLNNPSYRTIHITSIYTDAISPLLSYVSKRR